MNPRPATSRFVVWSLLALVCVGTTARAQDRAPVSVEPADLTRRADLIGREVVVDDRVGRFQYHPETRLFDEVYLRRCPDVAFVLPARLRYQQSPQAPAVKIRGVLRKEGERWVCDVTAIDLLPSDLDRLNRAIATLSRTDLENRLGWARWGERRGQAFKDEVLIRRAKEIETENLRTEAARPGRDPVEQGLGLAERARKDAIPEPEPSALVHQGIRAALARPSNAATIRTLLTRIEGFLPESPKPANAQALDWSRWEAPYTKDPAASYRSAPASTRTALDHRLWADALQMAIERQAAEDPKSLVSLADEASTRLPDRPELAAGLLRRGLDAATLQVGELRLAEVDVLARLYKERLNQPEKARELHRLWLDDQRTRRLSPRDAEGRIALAEQYEKLLDDRPAAVALLRDASAIDPQSREVADAFLRRGYRKVEGQWVEGSRTPPREATSEPEGTRDPAPEVASSRAPSGRGDDPLLNATPAQVLAKLSKPDRKVRIATRKKVIEQWIYFGPNSRQYINIEHKEGEPQPRVVAHYSLPNSTLRGSPAP